MHRLRQARFLARLVLAWFALAVGIAVASPLVKPQSLELVCSAGGAFRLVTPDSTGSEATLHATLDCPLCATAGAPPPVALVLAQAAPMAPAVVFLAAPRLVRFAAPALPARGPPSQLAA